MAIPWKVRQNRGTDNASCEVVTKPWRPCPHRFPAGAVVSKRPGGRPDLRAASFSAASQVGIRDLAERLARTGLLTRYFDSIACLPLATVRADNSTAATVYTAGTGTAVCGGTAPAYVSLVLTRTAQGSSKTSCRHFANGGLAEVISPFGLVTSYTYDGLAHETPAKQGPTPSRLGVITRATTKTAPCCRCPRRTLLRSVTKNMLM